MSKKKSSGTRKTVKLRRSKDERFHETDNEWIVRKIAESSGLVADEREDVDVVDANLLIEELIRGLERLSHALGLKEAYWIRIPKPEARVELETAYGVAHQGLLALKWSIFRGRLDPDTAKCFSRALRAIEGSQHNEVSLVSTLDDYAEQQRLPEAERWPSEEDFLSSMLTLMAKVDKRPLRAPGELSGLGEAGFGDAEIARECLINWVAGRGGARGRANNEELFGRLMRHLGHAPAASAVRSLRSKAPLKARGKQTQNQS